VTTIDVLDDEDVYEYQDKIDDFIVSGVTVCSDLGHPESGSGVAPQVRNSRSPMAPGLLPGRLAIKHAHWKLGTSQDLEDLGKIYETVNAILDDMKPFTISAVGQYQCGPCISCVASWALKPRLWPIP
jgi:hypothetical protein